MLFLLSIQENIFKLMVFMNYVMLVSNRNLFTYIYDIYT